LAGVDLSQEQEQAAGGGGGGGGGGAHHYPLCGGTVRQKRAFRLLSDVSAHFAAAGAGVSSNEDRNMTSPSSSSSHAALRENADRLMHSVYGAPATLVAGSSSSAAA
jgi:hypothetical protein